MIWIALALALAGDPAATSQEAARPATPRWIRTPSSADLSRYYPHRAMIEGLQGRAVVRCVAADDGHLTSCVILSETPEGQGFGEATVRIAQDILRVSTTTPDGASSVGAHVTVPIDWRIG